MFEVGIVRSVKPGDLIVSDIDFNGQKCPFRTWTVVKIYPHHVVAVRNEFLRSFCYGELVEMGREHQSALCELLILERNRGRDYRSGLNAEGTGRSP